MDFLGKKELILFGVSLVLIRTIHLYWLGKFLSYLLDQVFVLPQVILEFLMHRYWQYILGSQSLLQHDFERQDYRSHQVELVG